MNKYLLSLFIFLSFSSCSDNKFQIFFEAENTNGLIEGNDVILKGVTIGEIININLNKANNINIIVEFDKLKSFPIDSKFIIESSDLFGTKVISLELGSDNEIIKNREIIKLSVQESENIEFFNKIVEDFMDNNPFIKSIDSLSIQLEELNKKLDKQSQQ